MSESKVVKHPFYLVEQNTINDLEAYTVFRSKIGPLVYRLASFEILANETNITRYEGEYPANHFVVNRFDSKEAFESYYFAPEVQEVMKLRFAASTTYFLLGFESREESMPEKAPGKNPFYTIISVDITDPEEYAKYTAAIQPAYDKMKGYQLLSTEDEMITYEGEYPVNHITLARFDCRETFENFYNSPEYQDAKKHRLAGAKTNFVVGFEEMDPTDQSKVLPSK